jgi:hypothetical protein
MKWRLLDTLALVVVVPAAALAQVQQQSTPPTQSTQAAPLSPDAVTRAQVEGQTAAMNVGTGGWFGGSFASGVFLGLIGTGVSWGLAAGSNADMPPEKKLTITNPDPSYRAFAEKAYGDKVRAKRKSAALKGGLLGTAAFVLIYASASSGG